MSDKITGSLINAFYICPRKAWLTAHEMGPESDNNYIEIGKILSEETYKRERKEIIFENMKIDLVKKKNGDIIIGEVKKSSKGEKAAIMQLIYYLYRFKKHSFYVKGELLIPKERKRIPVELTEDIESELKEAFSRIERTMEQSRPPEPVKIRYCTNCAYREFCWV